MQEENIRKIQTPSDKPNKPEPGKNNNDNCIHDERQCPIKVDAVELISIAQNLGHLCYPDQMNRLSDWEIAAITDTRQQVICVMRHGSKDPNCVHGRMYQTNYASYLKHQHDCTQFCEDKTRSKTK